MKHLIIINGSAGVLNESINIEELVNNSFKGLEYEIYKTTAPRSVVSFLKDYFKNNKDLTRVYACGGDGTLHEVLDGIVGVKNVELALFPCGTGNDFAKIYGVMNDNIKEFQNFESLINGKATPIDISKVSIGNSSEPWYSINVVNFGFDAMVGAKGNENKLKGIKDPYGFKNAIVPAIIHGRFNNIIVSADGIALNKKRLLLSSVAQGQWIGGEYHCSPRSSNTDGLLEVNIMKCMPLIPLLARMFGKYHDGTFFENKWSASKFITAKCKKVTIDSLGDIDVCVDGEMVRGSRFEVEILPAAIKFVAPSKL